MNPQETWDEMEARHLQERRAMMAHLSAISFQRGRNGERQAKPSRHLRLEQISERVAARHGLSASDMRTATRTDQFCKARWEAFALAQGSGFSLAEIGRFFNRDHSTVRHGINSYVGASQ